MRKPWVLITLLLVVFVFSRWVNLTALPVFADEAIYVRWAQLMRQDFFRWVFFPMQDGKPPLHMIILSGILGIQPADPLWVSRALSALLGLVNLGLFMYLTKLMRGKRLSQVLAGGLYLILPFSLLHDRMGLIDGMFLTWLLVSFVGLMLLHERQRVRYGWLAGLGLGLAFWTKTTALFFPFIFVFIFLAHFRMRIRRRQLITWFGIGLALALGMGMFLSLRLTPVFASLFSRSRDFAYPVSEVLGGRLNHLTGNAVKMGRWYLTYLTLGGLALVLLPVIGRWRWRYVLKPWVLLTAAAMFSLPFWWFGKAIAVRYLLPALVFLIPLAALAGEVLWKRHKWIATGVLILIVGQALYFDIPFLFNPEKTPFAREDVEQYLTSWSAGYGNAQVRDFIRKEALDKKVVVATEGYFGTLPDGLLMYFDQSPLIENVEIFGIGQPVRSLPQEVTEKARAYDTYLVVNEHRLLFDPSGCCALQAAYARPLNGPSLLLLKVQSADAEL